MAEINGLLNRHTGLNPYRGFESRPHRIQRTEFRNDFKGFSGTAREVAQAGSAPGLGPGGRRFESCLPDEIHQKAFGDSRGL